MDINTVVITGNLTRDPILRSTNGGTKVCNLRVAVNGRRKDAQTGEWVDKPNFFSVTVWGARGEACAECLRKGSPVAIEGRLDWSEADEGEVHREYVQIVANNVRFMGRKPEDGGEGGEEEPSGEAEVYEEYAQNQQIATAEGPMSPSELAAVGSSQEKDNIPF